MSRPWPAIVLSLCCILAGCGDSGLRRAAVRGTVRVGEEPVEIGSITFVPIGENKGPTAGGVIENGKFDIPAERGPFVGENRVQIVGEKKTGRKIELRGAPGMLVDEQVPVVPAIYDTSDSDLVASIESGTNELNFEIPRP